jgi:hypothetical protein
MATPPRIVVRNWLIDRLREIAIVNGFHNDVQLVELRRRLTRDLVEGDCPAIVLDPGQDRPRRETAGGNEGNDHHREWDIDLMLLLRSPGDDQVEDAGEKYVADVQRRLIEKRFGNNGKPSDIQFRIVPDDFARIENNVAMAVMGITVFYDFRLGDFKP